MNVFVGYFFFVVLEDLRMRKKALTGVEGGDAGDVSGVGDVIDRT